MRFLLDTDHISLIQFPAEPAYSIFRGHLTGYSPGDITCCIVSFHEQTGGAHAAINKARRPEDVVRGYERLGRVSEYYAAVTVLPFDAAAAEAFSGLTAIRSTVGTLDLRIASIALSRGLTLLTRNVRDFARVPSLVTEDWTR